MAIKKLIKQMLPAVSPAGLTLLPVVTLLSTTILLAILLTGCGLAQSLFSGNEDGVIADATQALQSARNDADRAKAYSKRGVAYGDKARRSRKFKVPPTEEYERLFGLSLADHGQAIKLNPGTAEMYFNRAQAYYDRGSWDRVEDKDGKPWLDLAAVDFEKATQLDPKNDLAFDRLGLTHEANGESDKAIVDYTRELALNPLGKQRLTDAYCDRGFQLQQKSDYAAAAAEYQKSIEFGTANGDTCRSEPFVSLIWLYTTEIHQYDKAWDFVHRANKSGRRIPPELVDRLKKESGRTD
jgi:tetratricopeptide (TPR) repeat protein